jgi:RimJ/RimL family protein N-acetyltransferase
VSPPNGEWGADLTVPLEGSLVTLEPIAPEHAEELWNAAQSPEIWEWLFYVGADRERFEKWMQMTLAASADGSEGAFAVRERAGGEIVGSSRYLNVRPADRSVEIGWTWFDPRVWGTGVNTEVKLLLLGHAFDDLDCLRVEFKTDARNARSRAAIAAIPAQFEGILRKHMTVPDVGVRDSAYFSVIDEEWPTVRANLERRLRRPSGQSGRE